jgi:hypothetical protein
MVPDVDRHEIGPELSEIRDSTSRSGTSSDEKG